ncbi:FAD-binding oxidoreductase [Leptothoe kymatousa]|uniref:FAD-binding oxidoreductase n=1 Tax=Leptothoe kymatousa TAU-MAC 1615 TaxID=2364775 RepID=A0ABS5Y7N7_9CYAN|nr:FAD-binding oxidoreductase [Leptothoe kymatousa]MBT9313513.1 FAD-binding oxidoreductase [Leptothoe kymatousa TAU-MAC 1615]
MSPDTTFQSLLGSGQVVPWSQVDAPQTEGTNDPRFEGTEDLCIIYPESVEQLSAVVRTCYERRWRMVSCGQRTKLHWGGSRLKDVDVVISTARLNRLLDHWIEDFTTRVEAGLGFADLQSQLGLENQFWPVDPLYGDRATIGGIVATANGGSLRQRYGSVRDTVIGVQFVRYDGEVVKAGGRVVKNVAGYDLMKLMTGAYGSLGILSQVNLRLYPVAAVSQTVVLSGAADEIAEAALQTRLQGITPVAMDLIGASNGMRLVGRFQGIAAGVDEQVERFQAIAQAAGLESSAVEDSTFWASLALQLASPSKLLCKVGILPTELVPLLQLLAEVSADNWLARLHNASGLGLIALSAEAPNIIDILNKVRSHCSNHKGYLTVLQAPNSLTFEPWGYTGNALGMMKAIKQQFDPHDLLNSGRFVGGI